jgi:rhamnosyltransferase
MSSDKVFAVLVTHRPDEGLLKQGVEATLDQVGQMVVVDNGSSRDTLARLRGLCERQGLTLISLGENLGLAKAQNVGIEWSLRAGCSHVLLLDQDSIPEAGMVRELLSASRRLGRSFRIAAVGPRFVNSDFANESYFVQYKAFRIKRRFCRGSSPEESHRADFLISSGALLPSEALADVGGMDESLFIDHVDTEWFLRARSKGLRSCGVCSAKMRHRLGERTVRLRMPGRKRYVAQYKPERYYYIFRNSIWLCRRPYVPATISAIFLFRLLGIAAVALLAGSCKAQFCLQAVKGVKDGVFGSCPGRAPGLRQGRESS